MKKLLASTEYQYTSNGKEYYKLYVSRQDGSIVNGSRTLRAFTGATLDKKQQELQADIDKGAWTK